MKTETALTYDAVQLVAEALREPNRSQDGRIKSINCEGTDTWIHGNFFTSTSVLQISLIQTV